MLTVNNLVGFGVGGGAPAYYPQVTDGLEWYFDAGVSTSYPGSGASFFNIKEGASAGNLFVSGATFTGSAGGQSSGEYFDFDGVNDVFIDGTTAPQWIKDINRDGVAEWTLMMFIHPDGGGVVQRWLNTYDSVGYNHTFYAAPKADNTVQFWVGSGTGGDGGLTSTTTFTPAGWNVIAVSHSESGTQSAVYVNGTRETATRNLSTRAGTYQTNKFRAGLDFSNNQDFDGRVAIILGYSRALSAAELDILHNQYGPRFGLATV